MNPFAFALFIMLLTVASQSVRAQDLCGALQQVFGAAKENFPFDSIRHLDVPDARCKIAGNYEQHIEMTDYVERKKGSSWVCSWYDATLDKALEDESDAWEAEEIADWAARNALLAWVHATPSDTRTKAEYEQALVEHERAMAEVLQLEKITLSKSEDMHSQVRTLLSSIQQCIHKSTTRGSWGVIEEDVHYYTYSRGHGLPPGRRFGIGTWSTCLSGSSTTCIEVRADTDAALVTLEVYNANKD